MTYDETKHTRGGNPANTGEYSAKTNSAPESALPQRDLSDVMEFDHVITVGGDGTLSDKSGLHAPDVYADDADPFWGDSDWQVLRGFTGQYGYSGHVMHASEQVGGGLETHIRDNPGHYVVVEVRDEDGDFPDEPVGWAVAHKPLDEQPAPMMRRAREITDAAQWDWELYQPSRDQIEELIAQALRD